MKRKRIKKIKDSSDEDAGKSTRKQIRRVWGKDSLSQSTIQAEKEEKERKNRIAERQKKVKRVFFTIIVKLRKYFERFLLFSCLVSTIVAFVSVIVFILHAEI